MKRALIYTKRRKHPNTYEYNAVRNRTKKIVNDGTTTTTTTYTYDAADQLTAVNGQAYTYDANGNLTNNGNKTFVYDDDNRLIEVKNASGTTIASFTYDQLGRRISKTTSNGTIYYHYDGDSNQVLYETDANNNIVAEYTWDADGHPVTMTKGGVTYYYHLNGHGDVMALTDASGNVVAEYQYDAWGNILSKTGAMASANPYRYAGYYYDEETGLYYLMARYYDANIGRFITRDTFHGFEDDPHSLNLYAYTKNNPVMYVDPDGHYVQIVYTALRYLIEKVGYRMAMKAWEIAKPYIKKAIREAKKYEIDGPGGGSRIIQVRYRGGAPIFRLDWYPIKPGGPFTLHYHVQPDIKKHHVIWTSNIY
jgi:RHS repeat-associated protein